MGSSFLVLQLLLALQSVVPFQICSSMHPAFDACHVLYYLLTLDANTFGNFCLQISQLGSCPLQELDMQWKISRCAVYKVANSTLQVRICSLITRQLYCIFCKVEMKHKLSGRQHVEVLVDLLSCRVAFYNVIEKAIPKSQSLIFLQ